VDAARVTCGGREDKLEGHAFISYVRKDSLRVDRMQRVLEARGVRVWRDTADLWPGEDWRAKIRHAITDNALVFIACFSHNSASRQKSFQREELALAIDQMRLRRPDEPWLIPVRFDDCDVPDYDIGGGRSLASIQRADLFGVRSDEATSRLATAVLRILGQDSGVSTRAAARRAGSYSPLVVPRSHRADRDRRSPGPPLVGVWPLLYGPIANVGSLDDLDDALVGDLKAALEADPCRNGAHAALIESIHKLLEETASLHGGLPSAQVTETRLELFNRTERLTEQIRAARLDQQAAMMKMLARVLTAAAPRPAVADRAGSAGPADDDSKQAPTAAAVFLHAPDAMRKGMLLTLEGLPLGTSPYKIAELCLRAAARNVKPEAAFSSLARSGVIHSPMVVANLLVDLRTEFDRAGVDPKVTADWQRRLVGAVAQGEFSGRADFAREVRDLVSRYTRDEMSQYFEVLSTLTKSIRDGQYDLADEYATTSPPSSEPSTGSLRSRPGARPRSGASGSAAAATRRQILD
jgi:TIR domain-containing protein